MLLDEHVARACCVSTVLHHVSIVHNLLRMQSIPRPLRMMQLPHATPSHSTARQNSL